MSEVLLEGRTAVAPLAAHAAESLVVVDLRGTFEYEAAASQVDAASLSDAARSAQASGSTPEGNDSCVAARASLTTGTADRAIAGNVAAADRYIAAGDVKRAAGPDASITAGAAQAAIDKARAGKPAAHELDAGATQPSRTPFAAGPAHGGVALDLVVIERQRTRRQVDRSALTIAPVGTLAAGPRRTRRPHRPLLSGRPHRLVLEERHIGKRDEAAVDQ